MKRQVLVVSHADADGHVIAEQVRRNLSAIPSFEVTTLVDPERTKDHKTWLRLNDIPEIEKSDYVFFVDLMFAPASFGTEADALVHFVQERPKKHFFVLDHHPLPVRRLSQAQNVRALYRQDVLDCTFGPVSRMMIIAALCEKQPTRAGTMKNAVDDIVAKGVRRAAALGGPLPGAKLSALLRFDCWDALARLGQEDASEHPMPRGRRRAGQPPSKALVELDRTATKLLKDLSSENKTRSPMPYDFDTVTDRKVPKLKTPTARGDDLEAIVVLLELAAIQLATTPEATFTLDQLLDEARSIGGSDIEIDKKNAKIVLEKAKFIRKQGSLFQLR
jgi:hypothetical protein